VGVCRNLPGTRLEIDRIGRLYRARFPGGRPLATMTGTGADKASLIRQLTPAKDGKAWRYLHLATHAFFLPPPAPPRPRTQWLSFGEERDWLTWARNPLLLTGLVLSGANRSAEKGICRGEELAELDLRGTQVVVLSACDTALGGVWRGEGMIGLQRPFQLSGARNTIASLWKVHDAATSVLMEQFYTQLWVEKRSPLQALRQAQLFVLRNPDKVQQRQQELRPLLAQRRKELLAAGHRGLGDEAMPLPEVEQRRSDPALWAAFVLSGEAATDHVVEETPADSEEVQDVAPSGHRLNSWLLAGGVALGVAALFAALLVLHRGRGSNAAFAPRATPPSATSAESGPPEQTSLR
jgi:hypothetical protein